MLLQVTKAAKSLMALHINFTECFDFVKLVWGLLLPSQITWFLFLVSQVTIFFVTVFKKRSFKEFQSYSVQLVKWQMSSISSLVVFFQFKWKGYIDEELSIFLLTDMIR